MSIQKNQILTVNSLDDVRARACAKRTAWNELRQSKPEFTKADEEILQSFNPRMCKAAVLFLLCLPLAVLSITHYNHFMHTTVVVPFTLATCFSSFASLAAGGALVFGIVDYCHSKAAKKAHDIWQKNVQPQRLTDEERLALFAWDLADPAFDLTQNLPEKPTEQHVDLLIQEIQKLDEGERKRCLLEGLKALAKEASGVVGEKALLNFIEISGEIPDFRYVVEDCRLDLSNEGLITRCAEILSRSPDPKIGYGNIRFLIGYEKGWRVLELLLDKVQNKVLYDHVLGSLISFHTYNIGKGPRTNRLTRSLMKKMREQQISSENLDYLNQLSAYSDKNALLIAYGYYGMREKELIEKIAPSGMNKHNCKKIFDFWCDYTLDEKALYKALSDAEAFDLYRIKRFSMDKEREDLRYRRVLHELDRGGRWLDTFSVQRSASYLQARVAHSASSFLANQLQNFFNASSSSQAQFACGETLDLESRLFATQIGAHMSREKARQVRVEAEKLSTHEHFLSFVDQMIV